MKEFFSNKLKPSQNDEEFKDLGFGTKASSPGIRWINADGSFNIKRKGLSFWQNFNIYHTLITMTWGKFISIIFFAYIIVNIFFAFLYLLIGVEQLNGVKGSNLSEQFYDAFFFSTQTLTTVGYGGIHPTGFIANIIASMEALTGWLGLAFATGLLYGRFSRPYAKIIFSKNAIISPYRDTKALMFRIANGRSNQLIEVEAQINLSKLQKEEGTITRNFYDLKLERKYIQFFPLSWTLVHPITESSPLYNISERDFENSDMEILILIKGFDETFSQAVHARKSYKFNEIIWGAKFINIFGITDDNKISIRLDQIHEFENIEL